MPVNNLVLHTALAGTIPVETLYETLQRHGTVKKHRSGKGLSFKFRAGVCSFVLFKNKKKYTVICTGAKEKEVAFKEIKKLAYITGMNINSEPKVENMTVTYRIDMEFDLNSLYSLLEGSTFSQGRMIAVLWRHPKGTARIFGSGSIVIVGAKSENAAREVLQEIIKKIQSPPSLGNLRY